MGVWLVSAAITHPGFDNARGLVERGLDTPETAAGKNGGPCRLRNGSLPVAGCDQRCGKDYPGKGAERKLVHILSFMSLWTGCRSTCFQYRAEVAALVRARHFSICSNWCRNCRLRASTLWSFSDVTRACTSTLAAATARFSANWRNSFRKKIFSESSG